MMGLYEDVKTVGFHTNLECLHHLFGVCFCKKDPPLQSYVRTPLYCAFKFHFEIYVPPYFTNSLKKNSDLTS